MANVIVAGGATGIGRAAVRGFRARGDNVLLVDHRSAADLAAEAAPGAIRCLERDLAAAAAPAEVVALALTTFGSLDTVLITAALMLSASLADWTCEMWDRSVALNLRMSFLFAQAAAEPLARSDNPSIIFISSTGAIRGHAGMSAYQATKAALPALCRSLTAV
jgi:NAD(P)-dependent dehydrogenase (short-subunit alcohol dehydrogenase family)